MRCVSPLTLRHPNNPREFITVPCGKCVYCRINKANSWAYRLRQERKASVCSYFLTLTYDDSQLTFNELGNPVLVRDDVTKFMKRFRKYIDYYKAKVRFYGCGEYGSTSARPHYHILLFFDNLLGFDAVSASVHDAWHKGFYELAPVNENRIHYTCKYMIKQVPFIEELGLVKPFSLMSRNPGIGNSALLNPSIVKRVRKDYNFLIADNSHSLWMPRYYVDKLLPTNCPSSPGKCSSKEDYHSRKVKKIVQNLVLKRDMDNFWKELHIQEMYDKKHGEGEYMKRLSESLANDVVQQEKRLDHKLNREI